jgi:hypothetical protein
VGVLAISLTLAAIATIGMDILFARPWGLAGVAAGMAIAKLITFLPLQGYQVGRILRIADVQIEQAKSESLVA